MDSKTKPAFLANWMEALRPQIQNTRLLGLAIPASHDSNTVTLNSWNPLYPFGACQSLCIYQQLEHGVRMLDLRYGAGKGKVKVIDQHGPITGGDLFYTFRQVKQFLDTYPYEFVMINMQNESELSPETKAYLIEEIAKLLGEYLVNGDDFDTWFKMDSVTMGQIFQRKKRILLFGWSSIWEGSFYDKESCRKLGIHLQSDCIESRWHDTDKFDVMMTNNINDLKKWNELKLQSQKLFTIQIVLTIQGKMEDLLNYVYFLTVPTIKNLARQITRSNKLLNFLFHALRLGANLVMFDFVELEMTAIKMIILSNVKHDISIKACYLGTKNCLHFIHPGMLPNKMFLVTNTKKIFNAMNSDGKEILIVYSENGGRLKCSIITEQHSHKLICSSDYEENISGLNSERDIDMIVLYHSKGYIFENIERGLEMLQVTEIIGKRFPMAKPVLYLKGQELIYFSPSGKHHQLLNANIDA